jgi:hypothetical protein
VVTTIPNLGIAAEGKQDILFDMVRLAWVAFLFPLSLSAQKLEPCPPDLPALRMEQPLQVTGLHVGGVEEFPAGVYRPIGKNNDGVFYLFERPLKAKLMADIIQVSGGLFIPSDPEDEARGWYSMPEEKQKAVIAPEESFGSTWEGDPTLPASNPYQAANLAKIRRLTGLSAKPKLVPLDPVKP